MRGVRRALDCAAPQRRIETETRQTAMDTLSELARLYIIPIGLAYFIAWIVHRNADDMAKRALGITGRASVGPRMRAERERTLADLGGSTISFVAFTAATIFMLGRFIDSTTLVWLIGLLSAGFGFGARPLISDLLTGMTFIFEDAYDVGEKVEVMGVEGVIERIRLRTTLIRAPSGELFVVPNGEVRIIRNFSRGRYSVAHVTLRIAADQLGVTLAVLDDLGRDAVHQEPDLIEAWRVISPEGKLAHEVDLTLLIKTQFGAGAELRPRLLALIQQRLAEHDIALRT